LVQYCGVESVAEEIVEEEELDFTGLKVLLVEDNELNRDIAEELLKESGFEVDLAEDGVYAVEKIRAAKEGDYDLILMDVQMPIMNGYDATKAIRSLPITDAKTIPIIAMTANAFMADVQEAKNSGMNEHVAKPVELNRLRDVMTKWLG
jgi:CheY-like chemotaxis protein